MGQFYLNGGVDNSQKVCHHWRAGKCTRTPCQYLHAELPPQNSKYKSPSPVPSKPPIHKPYNAPSSKKWVRQTDGDASARRSIISPPTTKQPLQKSDKVCQYWIQGKCNHGDNCRFQHCWFTTRDGSFSMLTQLSRHQKPITGIVLPSGAEQLVSSSKDKLLKIWNCHTGQCTHVFDFGDEIGSLFTQGVWIFIGVPNGVKVWNIKAHTDFSLSGPVGQVYALATSNNGMLFAGCNDGRIMAWRFPTEAGTLTKFSSDPTAFLKGHSRAVISLCVGNLRLYSGSMDNTIRVWDLETMKCLHTLTQHTSAVTSLVCWENYLLSCSLDRTVKVWDMKEDGVLKAPRTHREDSGVIALATMVVADGKTILMCSCNDNTLRLYDLPSFNKRGEIFSEEEIRAVGIGPHSLFFTGDAAGHLRVWKWS